MSAGWGLGPWGLDPWGGGVLGVSLVQAEVLSVREVKIVLSAEPQHAGPDVSGDALNPTTWTVRRLDTGMEFTVIGAAMVGSTAVLLRLYEALGPFAVSHSVATTSLLSLSGEVVTAPEAVFFRGAVDRSLATPVAQAATRRFGVRDLANPPTSATSIGGTLKIRGGGDYANEEGPALTKKLILRRVTFRPGDLWYAPEYGLGLAEKEPVQGSLVPRAAEAERQIAQEPDVETARVGLSIDAQGVLTVSVRARIRQTGQEVSVSYTPTVDL